MVLAPREGANHRRARLSKVDPQRSAPPTVPIAFAYMRRLHPTEDQILVGPLYRKTHQHSMI